MGLSAPQSLTLNMPGVKNYAFMPGGLIWPPLRSQLVGVRFSKNWPIRDKEQKTQNGPNQKNFFFKINRKIQN